MTVNLVAPHEDAPFLNVAVYDRPIPQGSKKGYRRGKGVQVVDDNKDVLEPWRALVTARVGVRDTPSVVKGAPVLAVVVFVKDPPGRIPKDRLGYPAVAPDLDKYQRAIGDSLTDARVIVDDGQITDWVATKRYVGQPGAWLTRPGVWIRLYRIVA